jgi:hypothetical protein
MGMVMAMVLMLRTFTPSFADVCYQVCGENASCLSAPFGLDRQRIASLRGKLKLKLKVKLNESM